MTGRTERKLGRAVIEAMLEIQDTPKDNVARFKVAHRALERAVKKYTDHSGSDKLLHSHSHYGFELTENKRRHAQSK